MNKVLIISYYWPPGSGAGVQRWLKFSKYLPLYGWDPVILTVDPAFATYPALDYSLNNEIPRGLAVYKTKATDYFRFYRKDKSKIPSAGFAVNGDGRLLSKISRFIRGNFFIPDPRKGWNRFAFHEACNIIERENIKHIITTSPPHSTQLIGLKLKKRYPHLMWIADLRDPWTDIYYYNQFFPTIAARKIDACYESRVLRSTDKIITVGASLRDLFASKIPGLKEKTEVVSNGFDGEDFENMTPCKPEIFTISYIGTLSDTYPVSGLVKALSLLKERNIVFRLRFTGIVSERQRELILSAADEPDIEFIPYVDHSTAIKYMLNSSALLLIIPDHLSSKSIITGKLFEYLAAGKPVICLAPVDGDAAGLLRETGHGETFNYNDSEAIAGYIMRVYSEPAIPGKESINRFSRIELSKKIVSILNQKHI